MREPGRPTWEQEVPERPRDAVFVAQDVVEVHGEEEVEEVLDGVDDEDVPQRHDTGGFEVAVVHRGLWGLCNAVRVALGKGDAEGLLSGARLPEVDKALPEEAPREDRKAGVPEASMGVPEGQQAACRSEVGRSLGAKDSPGRHKAISTGAAEQGGLHGRLRGPPSVPTPEKRGGEGEAGEDRRGVRTKNVAGEKGSRGKVGRGCDGRGENRGGREEGAGRQGASPRILY